ncbi:hypothetical protein GCM10023238_33200 [Streptomyces heliomycini]
MTPRRVTSVRFLKQGDKVKITIMFRGREQSRPELGYRLLQRLAEDVADLGFVESNPKQDGRNMIMVLGPHKKKTEAMAEARQAQEARKAEAKANPGKSQNAATPRPSRPRNLPRRDSRGREPQEANRHKYDAPPCPVLMTGHRSATTRRERRYAEEQVAQRCQQALQGHRLRQGAP